MKQVGGYKEVRVSKSISKSKLAKALKGGTISFSKDDLNGSQPLLMHPENAKKIIAAQKANRGVRLDITHGEIHHDLSSRQGGSIWESIKNGLSTVWNTVGKPVLGAIGDAITYSNPELAPLREGVRSLVGVGFKGSQAAKARMAAVRAKKRGGSFKL
ncbi:hypothetical protein LEN26_016015 [Aphanomyces euteiches]|nr:hypothetical protein LEN26_016015 [Aphanomyces euteiches]KAH9105972.1 hypothetical protein AeMF1_018323 [Aphanomyces euteiches]KAH9188046.1 hypothetical protein AeNC1_009978 [Aphanomyces euteiches]